MRDGPDCAESRRSLEQDQCTPVRGPPESSGLGRTLPMVDLVRRILQHNLLPRWRPSRRKSRTTTWHCPAA